MLTNVSLVIHAVSIRISIRVLERDSQCLVGGGVPFLFQHAVEVVLNGLCTLTEGRYRLCLVSSGIFHGRTSLHRCLVERLLPFQSLVLNFVHLPFHLFLMLLLLLTFFLIRNLALFLVNRGVKFTLKTVFFVLSLLPLS